MRPVKLSGRWLIDGCLVNPIPVSACRALGAQSVVAVNLNCEFGRGGILIDDHEIDETAPQDANAKEAPITRWNGKGALRVAAPSAFWLAAGVRARHHVGYSELVQHL